MATGELIIIDHLTGSRRGQRQELLSSQRIRFGRHPESEVCFDAYRDLDASSRHAELVPEHPGYRLRDVGSSNGTLVAGQRIAELEVRPGEPVIVEFGAGGPMVRLFIGAPADAPPVPALPPGSSVPVRSPLGPISGWLPTPLGWVALGAAVVLAGAAVVLALI